MSYALRRQPAWWRSPSFGIVAALHAAGLVALVTWETSRPDSVILQALSVRLIESEAPKVVAPKPRIEPPKPTPVPKTRAAEPPRPMLLAAAEPAPAAAATMTVAPPPAPAKVDAAAPSASAPAPLVEARFDADYLQNPKPIYPPMSRRLQEEGRVILRVHVGADGTAHEVAVKQSSGFARLDGAARDAVSRWRFVPARRGADAVDAWVAVPIVFSLEH